MVDIIFLISLGIIILFCIIFISYLFIKLIQSNSNSSYNNLQDVYLRNHKRHD